MLRNSFFKLTHFPSINEKLNIGKAIDFSVGIILNPDHSIFKGHFPYKPIVPGVTYIEMIREIMEISLKIKIQLKEASNIKFLSITDPTLQPALNFHFNLILKEKNLISTKVLISTKNSVVIKFTGVFSI
jgi:3-hydroxyacyl-[acyl-carrier-protein] dehydratase